MEVSSEHLRNNDDVNEVFGSISRGKPLLLSIYSPGVDDQLIKRFTRRQAQRKRYYWVEDSGTIKTNLITGDVPVIDIKGSKIEMFIQALHRDKRSDVFHPFLIAYDECSDWGPSTHACKLFLLFMFVLHEVPVETVFN